MDESRISRVQAWEVSLEMPRELVLGAIRYRTRDYTIARVTLEDGTSGVGVGYTRGTPLTEALRLLGQASLGEPGDPSHVMATLRARFAPGWGALVRAASLLDIALWDARARRQNRPLAESFGGPRPDLPLMVVGGYFLGARDRGEILDEITRFVDEGYQTIKFIIPGHDVKHDIALVGDVHERLPAGVELAVDFHGAFAAVDSAADYCAAFQDLGVRFVEDPFPSYETDRVTQLVERLPLPIAAGEDVITPATYRTLIDGGVQYLRTDATASGGYTAALEGVAAAVRAGSFVAPHVWPHIHAPMACASPNIAAVEVIPGYVGADPIVNLLTEDLPIRGGRWTPPEHSGLYLPLDWDRIEQIAAVRVDCIK